MPPAASLDRAWATRHIPPPFPGKTWIPRFSTPPASVSGWPAIAAWSAQPSCADLASAGCEVLTVGREEVDLTRQADVERWLDKARPDAIMMAAARVGGIHANSTLPADFLFINLMIGANVVNAAYRAGVKRLVNLGSSCMYPVGAPQPIAEASIGEGRPEPTNEAYAVAKLATASLAGAYRKQFGADYVTVIPTNLYGPGDKFDPLMSHVAPALMRRMIEARDARAPKVEFGVRASRAAS